MTLRHTARALAALLLLGCGSEPSATPSATPAATTAPTELPLAAPSTPRAPTPAPVAAPSAPPLDLIHAVATTITASSAYQRDVAQLAHLIDGDLETAWNSRTGDLTGTWIEITLPADATVSELLLTAGFTHRTPTRDLFTSNHRVAEVRITHDGADLGAFPLDVDARELQHVPVSGGSGTYRVTLTRVAEGSRHDWREACVSELRVMGHASAARDGAITPTLRLAPSAVVAPEEPAAPTVAPPTAAPPAVLDAAYFLVAGRGLVRLGSTVDVLADDLSGFDVDAAGRVAIAAGGTLSIVADGQRRQVPLPQPVNLVALGPRGTVPLSHARSVAASWYRPAQRPKCTAAARGSSGETAEAVRGLANRPNSSSSGQTSPSYVAGRSRRRSSAARSSRCA